MLNLNNNNMRWIKKDSNDAAMNFTETCDGSLQICNSSNAFYSLKKKRNRNNLRKKYEKNDSLTSLNLSDWSNQQNLLTHYPIKESKKLDVCTHGGRRHITDTNSLKHFSMHPTCTLNIYNNNYSNSLMTDSNTIHDVSKCLTRNQSFTEHIIPSSQSTLRTNICITESWREINHVDKIRLTAALLFHVNSVTNKIMPLINLHALANPFLQIPIQACRMANNINLNMAEVLCRKRTEVAVISWMAITLNQ
ncbi:uncharacterized protein LOC100570320 isoform X1 [Acyrthosiphon pisum]|uniref:Uncharacterized protein n=1 Tax=Acyrthosiphon pisum TaxID=7029 RepID=A0A8R2AD94_ACYPI|nr:uncharacterized protein LOC100570320 isoform X1 [Acyrthosiphon pisum]|eukprot:XP_003242402.1 PREDICTED: uncharacterized protein LOC100570320 isoform X2 [Acyrthosiphon pisum]